jgi:FdhE protein
MSDRGKSGPPRDFTSIGQVSEPEFAVLPDPGVVFSVRAARLAAVADGHPLAPYLLFLSRLVAVQDAGQAALPPPSPDLARYTRSQVHAMPALSKDVLSQGNDFARTLDWFLRRATVADAPDAAELARVRVATAAWPERLALAEAVFEGAYPAERIGESLYIALALQLHLTRLAAQLDAGRLRTVGDGVCPACGGLPVASLIVGWANADRARYCCCGLCATMWNYVRIKCTVCGSTADISYRLIAEQSNDLTVETCASCNGYIKHFHLNRNPKIEPFADDIGSSGLDLLVREQGFFRAAANPLMVVMAPVADKRQALDC